MGVSRTYKNMLYIYWVVILGDHDIKKISFENFQFSAARGEKLHKQVVYLSLASLGLVAANSRLHASFTSCLHLWGLVAANLRLRDLLAA